MSKVFIDKDGTIDIRSQTTSDRLAWQFKVEEDVVHIVQSQQYIWIKIVVPKDDFLKVCRAFAKGFGE